MVEFVKMNSTCKTWKQFFLSLFQGKLSTVTKELVFWITPIEKNEKSYE